MIKSNKANMFSKVSPFIISHTFDELAVIHGTCYSAFKRDNLIKHKNITNLSWAQLLWQFNDGREDVVPGLC